MPGSVFQWCTVAYRVRPAATITTIASSAELSVRGQPITLTATVSSPAGQAHGFVEFLIDGGKAATLEMIGAVASWITSGLSAGTHRLEARYLGGEWSAASVSTPLSHVVGAASTSTLLATSPNPSEYRQLVAIEVRVTPLAPGGGIPGGLVEIFDGKRVLATLNVEGGVASMTTSTLKVGTHKIRADFLGDGDNYVASQSVTLVHTVTQRKGPK